MLNLPLPPPYLEVLASPLVERGPPARRGGPRRRPALLAGGLGGARGGGAEVGHAGVVDGDLLRDGAGQVLGDVAEHLAAAEGAVDLFLVLLGHGCYVACWGWCELVGLMGDICGNGNCRMEVDLLMDSTTRRFWVISM